MFIRVFSLTTELIYAQGLWIALFLIELGEKVVAAQGN